MKLSIIIPAYNEEKRILPVLENYYSFFSKKLGKNFEIIIIPNNCSDHTPEIVNNFCENKREAKFFEIKKYSGKGGAVMKGFDLAKGNFIGFVDADESTSPEEFFKLFLNLEDNDGIIGSRRIEGAKIMPKRKLGKRLSSFIFYMFVKLIFHWQYKDTQCGAKIFKKNVAKFLSQNCTEKGWIFDINLLDLCKKQRYKIKESPLFWQDDEGSHISNLDGIKSFFKVIKYKFIF